MFAPLLKVKEVLHETGGLEALTGGGRCGAWIEQLRCHLDFLMLTAWDDDLVPARVSG